jgi:CheY-like chemotaxis protein
MKILVIDDSRLARRMVIKLINEILGDNIEIIQAVDGKEAVSLYKEHSPKVCFMDLTMPILDGFQATLLIKEYDKNAKVIIVSADIQEGSIQKAKENGAIGFIKKPINSDNLKNMLDKLELL